jgi:hypothetical protein
LFKDFGCFTNSFVSVLFVCSVFIVFCFLSVIKVILLWYYFAKVNTFSYSRKKYFYLFWYLILIQMIKLLFFWILQYFFYINYTRNLDEKHVFWCVFFIFFVMFLLFKYKIEL